MKQYEVLKPFYLEFFRPVVEGELVTLDPNHIVQYDLTDKVKEINSDPKSTELEHSEPEPEK